MDPVLYYGVVSGLALVVVLLAWKNTQKHKLLPPGPPRQFLVGNLKDIPSTGSEWVVYKKTAEECNSDIVYYNVLGSHLLVINSFEAARDLLDKKGALYSSRPRLVMIKELMGWDWNLILMSYGKIFNAYRRVVQQEFQANVVPQYRPVIEQEVISLLGRLLEIPDALVKHLKRTTAAIIMMVTYGHQVTSEDDEYVALAEAVRDHGEKTPGANLVDIFPILKYVPAWFPGAEFKRHALFARQLSMDMRSAPFQMVKRRMAAGTAQPSIVSRLLQSDLAIEELNVSQDEFVQNSSGVVYSAGADTTATAMINFCYAMTLYPEVEKRAQEELDRVVGRDRLPSFEDRPNMPYIANITKESLRWKTVAPMGVPHATTDEDTYRGRYIPKDTTVLANIYAMLHDESVYKNPDEFNPDRYDPDPVTKSEGEPDPSRAAFGFGRRICPGRFFADDSVWLAIAMLLHVFNITRPKDAPETKVTWSSGLVSLPSPFPFSITPRFPGARELVSTASDVHA